MKLEIRALLISHTQFGKHFLFIIIFFAFGLTNILINYFNISKVFYSANNHLNTDTDH